MNDIVYSSSVEPPCILVRISRGYGVSVCSSKPGMTLVVVMLRAPYSPFVSLNSRNPVN